MCRLLLITLATFLNLNFDKNNLSLLKGSRSTRIKLSYLKKCINSDLWLTSPHFSVFNDVFPPQKPSETPNGVLHS